MGGTLAGSAARIAAGIGIVACAAVIAFAAGGSGVFGGLGGLFGRDGASLEVAKGEAPAADIVAAPTAVERALVQRSRLREPASRDNGQRRQARKPASGLPRTPSTGPVGGQPAPSPAPALPPLTPAPPAPAPSPVVTTVGATVKQLTSQAPPEAKPLTQPIDDAVDTLVQTCGSLPVCP